MQANFNRLDSYVLNGIFFNRNRLNSFLSLCQNLSLTVLLFVHGIVAGENGREEGETLPGETRERASYFFLS